MEGEKRKRDDGGLPFNYLCLDIFNFPKSGKIWKMRDFTYIKIVNFVIMISIYIYFLKLNKKRKHFSIYMIIDVLLFPLILILIVKASK